MKKFYAILASITTIVAALMATSACFIFLYQPTEPTSLRDE